MCENMAISDGHYNEFGNCSVSDEEKERRALTMCVSYLGKGRRTLDTCISHRKQRATCYIGACLPFT
jgi:hypothetical protein